MDAKFAEFAQKLGARIVQLRKEHNFAQERLATLARMNKGYLSSVESGQRVPSVGMLARLSKVLQVQIFDLFVFPDGGPLARLWEEIRTGSSPAAEQLRLQFGLEALGAARAGARSTRGGRTAVSAKRKATSKETGKTGSRAGRALVTRTSGREHSPRAAANRGAKRRSR